MQVESVEHEVRKFIIESFLFGQDDPDLNETASLLEKGVIDSTGVLELVGFLEKRFGIKVADEEFVPENLDTIARIARLVERKRTA